MAAELPGDPRRAVARGAAAARMSDLAAR